MNKTRLLTSIAFISISLSFSGCNQESNSHYISLKKVKHNRIVGGTKVPNEKKYPWMVALIRSKTDYSTYSTQFCGGSLIDKRWVVTAAHCVEGRSPRDFEILVGTNILDRQNGSLGGAYDPAYGKLVKVKQVIVHPDYDSYSKNNDIALVKLEKEVDNKPIQIATTQNLIDKNATIIGWGNTEPNSEVDTTSYLLLETTIPIVENYNCRFTGSSLTENMICAGYLDGHRDTGAGDSGGPLMIEENQTLKLAGITSFGSKYGGYYGVYTKVANYDDFIDKYLNKNSSTQKPKPNDTLTDAKPTKATWTTDDLPNRYRNKRYMKKFKIILDKDSKIELSLKSSIDTYLFLTDDKGNVIKENDDFDGTNSKIVSKLKQGTYFAIATTYYRYKTGDFTIMYKTLQNSDINKPKPKPQPPTHTFYGAFSYSYWTGRWGYTWHKDTLNQAREDAISHCGSWDCRVLQTIQGNECMALATNPYKEGYWSVNNDKNQAQNDALRDCNNNLGNCSIEFVFCADGR